MTFAPVEVRQPLFDLRLVRYVFSIPPVPYLVDKEILCQAVRHLLPEAVLRRPKTTVPAAAVFRHHLDQDLEGWKAAAISSGSGGICGYPQGSRRHTVCWQGELCADISRDRTA